MRMRVALLVPALDEERALARTAPVMAEAVASGVVDTAVLLDGGSRDDTIAVARDHGVEVLDVAGFMSGLGPVLGKGDSLFRGVHAIDADAYVFLDADIGNVSVAHVAVLAERIRAGDIGFVKGGFVRVDEHGVPREVPGGRVTEEVARPLLSTVSPVLAALRQPLSGQVAVDAGFVRSVAMATGYGVEIAMVLDAWRLLGPEGMCEVDMGTVHNRWKPSEALAEVRDQVLAGASLREVNLPGFGPVRHPSVVDRRA